VNLERVVFFFTVHALLSYITYMRALGLASDSVLSLRGNGEAPQEQEHAPSESAGEEGLPGQDRGAVPVPGPAAATVTSTAVGAGGVLPGAGRPGEGALRGARRAREPSTVQGTAGRGGGRVRVPASRRRAAGAAVRRRGVPAGDVGDERDEEEDEDVARGAAVASTAPRSPAWRFFLLKGGGRGGYLKMRPTRTGGS
jgi:hypothetical protein